MALKAYTSYRLYITKAVGSHGGTAGVSEWRMWEDEDGSGPNLLTGGTAGASGTESGQSPTNAFDGAPGTFWRADGGGGTISWLRYTLPAAKVARRMEISYNVDTYYGPREFILQGSNDNGSTWETVASFQNFLTQAGGRTVMLSRRFGGRAVLSDGSAANKVSLLRWATLEKYADVTPDPQGLWECFVDEAEDFLVLFFGPVGYRPIAEGPITPPSIDA